MASDKYQEMDDEDAANRSTGGGGGGDSRGGSRPATSLSRPSLSRPGTSFSGGRPGTSLTVGSLGGHSAGYGETGWMSRPMTGGPPQVRLPPRLAYISRVTDTLVDDKTDVYRQLERALEKLATPREVKDEVKPRYMQWRKEQRPASAMLSSMVKKETGDGGLPLNRSHLHPIGALELGEDELFGKGKKKGKKKKKKKMLDDDDGPQRTQLSLDDLEAKPKADLAKRGPLSPLKFDAYKREKQLKEMMAKQSEEEDGTAKTSAHHHMTRHERSNEIQSLLGVANKTIKAIPKAVHQASMLTMGKPQVFMGGVLNMKGEGQYVSDARQLVDQAQKVMERKIPKNSSTGSSKWRVGADSSGNLTGMGSTRSFASIASATTSGVGDEATSLVPRTVHGMLLTWAGGASGAGVSSSLLPDVRAKVWAKDVQEFKKLVSAVVAIQREWRRYMQNWRYAAFKKGKERRRLQALGNAHSLWLRVILQRPGVRVLCSQFLIAWRVHVRELQIAADKAEDLKEVWGMLSLKRNFKSWQGMVMIERHSRRLCYSKHFYGAMLAWRDYQRMWKEVRLKNMGTFVWHAFRALYFYGRCSRKMHQRSFRLFRYLDESVDPLSMPVARFTGYNVLFNCEELLESFQWKDRREMKIMRLVYIRLMPKVVSAWSIFVDNNKKTRYAMRHSTKRMLKRGLRMLKTHADEMAEQRIHEQDKVQRISGLEDAENLAKNKVDVVDVDEMDTLADLVEHEEKEQLRMMLKEEKRKLIIKMRFDQLKREQAVLRELPAKYEESMRLLERMLVERDKGFSNKIKEENKLSIDEKKADRVQWKKAIDGFVRVLEDGFNLLDGILERQRENFSADVFYMCWCRLRKAAAHVRIRRVVNRVWIQRRLAICVRHRRMKNSVHRYRKLKLMYTSWLKWMHLVEFNYLESTPGLKEVIRRRRELSTRISDLLMPIGRLLSIPEACQRLDVSFALWLERVHFVRSRREVVHLWHVRRCVRMIHRCFDFLKTGVIWRERSKMLDMLEEPDKGRAWVERNASADIRLWKRKFFMGVSYAEILRSIEERLKLKFMGLVKGSARLPQLISDRRKEVERRVNVESRLLLQTLDEIEAGRGDAQSIKMGVFAKSFPVEHWGTVLNLRKHEVMATLDRMDAFARIARHEFDSAVVAFSLSQWLFRVKCEGLPMETDQTLTTSKTYWKNIKNLFQMSRSGQIKISRD